MGVTPMCLYNKIITHFLKEKFWGAHEFKYGEIGESMKYFVTQISLFVGCIIMAHRLLRDVEADGWERSDFPIICESCLGDNPYLRMVILQTLFFC